MDFQFSRYEPAVQAILALGENGVRPMPLAPTGPTSAEAHKRLKTHKPSELFAGSRCPEGAMSGLYLYFSSLDEAHTLAQELETPEGSFWHGIMHRQEPDPGNAGYWFRRVGKHAIFPALAEAANRLDYKAGDRWDPLRFIDYCEAARRRPGSVDEKIARAVQLAEWQLLFDYCAVKVS